MILERLKRLLWYPTLDEVSQVAHFALGLAFVWGPVAVLQCSPWWGIAFAVAFAAVKEFVVDTILEGDSQANNWRDFCWYCFGAAVAGMTCFAAGRF